MLTLTNNNNKKNRKSEPYKAIVPFGEEIDEKVAEKGNVKRQIGGIAHENEIKAKVLQIKVQCTTMF